jgi:RND family efflux transporter MFP subunit
MAKMNIACFLILYGVLFIGCKPSSHEHDSHEMEIPSTSVMLWTDKMELFMEYPIPVAGEPLKFIIHLTTLDDFKPVTEGTVILRFTSANNEAVEFKAGKLLREGIFTPEETIPTPGNYSFTIDYVGNETSDSFDIGQVEVYSSKADIPAQPESEDSGISYLKEQQWKTDFETRLAENRKVRSSVVAAGEIIPKLQSYAEIVSPVDGIIDVSRNRNMVIPGNEVVKGQAVTVLTPPLDVSNSWTDMKLAYQNSKNEFERAERLLAREAISRREYEKIKNDYLTRKAGYESISGAYGQGSSESFDLRTPITGIINEVFIVPGQKVTAGQKIMSVIDSSEVWLRANMYEKDYYKIGTPNGASFRISGMDSPVLIDEDDFKLVSEGNVIDAWNRTIPFIFEIENPNGILKIGQIFQVDLYTSEEKDAVTIPESAIYDDDGQNVVFIHKEGETFEKRSIEAGDRYLGFVEVRSGLNEGERVVTKGVYQVKLASNTASIGHPHAH